MKPRAVLEHYVSDLTYEHTLPQPHFQIHEKPRRRRSTRNDDRDKDKEGHWLGITVTRWELTFHWLP